ncbi:hypothetical protein DUNSADRAFT_15294 [Dunaliella salina]|uniref:Uncharacterized protein n=1 Tax=Dunaliella salina TaxID=3046 RepID=A0ABQ7G5P9_DUNSA|nr:hypothetical protein DUNSADRAFT_15294 [Dunaliella salina]|eukprot:KAF5829938.1 hypothetical protein DUNSADRAFT_15294 [Dunaliella salina]
MENGAQKDFVFPVDGKNGGGGFLLQQLQQQQQLLPILQGPSHTGYPTAPAPQNRTTRQLHLACATRNRRRQPQSRDQPAGYVDPSREPLPFWGTSLPQAQILEGVALQDRADEGEEAATDEMLGWGPVRGSVTEAVSSPSSNGAAAAEAAEDPEVRRELIAALKRDFPWLYTSRAVQTLGVPLRNKYAQMLRAAVPLLVQYDIASPDGRPPHIGPSPPQFIEPSLTARAAARWEAAQRTPRLLSHEAVLPPPSQSSIAANETAASSLKKEDSLPGAGVPADDRWVRREAEQASYLTYMHELRRALGLPPRKMLPSPSAAAAPLLPGQAKRQQRSGRRGSTNGAGTEAEPHGGHSVRQQQQQHQQQQHENQGQEEHGGEQGQHLQLDSIHADQLDQQLLYQVGICDDWLQLSHLAAAFEDVVGPLTAAALYKRTTSGPTSPKAYLLNKLCTHAQSLLQQEQQRLDPRARSKRRNNSSGIGSSYGEPIEAGVNPGLGHQEWQAADYAQLLWGLGSVGHVPPQSLLQLACSACYLRLDRFQPAQLWGMLWGLARLSRACGFLPEKRWMTRFLKACSRVMGDFDAEGLGNLIWSVAALQCIIPEREWMRQFVGACSGRLRSFQATHLVQLVEALAVLGYTPRDEICMSIMGQIRRQMHTMSGPQLSAILRAIAIAPRWKPYRQFLYDFVVQSQPKLASLNASQASGILWAFAKFGFLPEPSYTAGVASQVALALPPPTAMQTLQTPAAALQTSAPPSQIPTSSSSSSSRGGGTGNGDIGNKTEHASSEGGVDSAQSHQTEGAGEQLVHASGGVQPSSPSRGSTDNTGSAALSWRGGASAPAQSPNTLSLFSGADGEDLSMALWSIAELQAQDVLHTTLLSRHSTAQQAHQPQKQRWVAWLDAWLERASVAAPTFSGPAAATSLWALGKLGIQPPPVLLDALLLRVSVLLPELGPQEMVQVARALVALQYRPSDAWLTAFVAQCRTHLPALAGDDLGMLLWALSSLGTPMDQEWLLAYCREAARGWTTHTGESLGRMAWGLSQYNFSPFSNANPESGPAPAALANAPGTEQVFELPAPRYDSIARVTGLSDAFTPSPLP